jgi:hypothetical protein
MFCFNLRFHKISQDLLNMEDNIEKHSLLFWSPILKTFDFLHMHFIFSKYQEFSLEYWQSRLHVHYRITYHFKNTKAIVFINPCFNIPRCNLWQMVQMLITFQKHKKEAYFVIILNNCNCLFSLPTYEDN